PHRRTHAQADAARYAARACRRGDARARGRPPPGDGVPSQTDDPLDGRSARPPGRATGDVLDRPGRSAGARPLHGPAQLRPAGDRDRMSSRMSYAPHAAYRPHSAARTLVTPPAPRRRRWWERLPVGRRAAGVQETLRARLAEA